MAGNPSTTLTNKDQVLAQLTNHRGDHLLVVGGRDDPHCVCENLKEDTIFTHLIFQLQKITAPTYFHILHLYLTTDSLITEPVCMKKKAHSGNKDVFVLFWKICWRVSLLRMIHT